MDAANLVFPQPLKIAAIPGRLERPRALALKGEALPAWLRDRLGAACRAAQLRLTPTADRRLTLSIEPGLFHHVDDPDLRAQSYRLRVAPDGNVTLEAPGREGLQHGVITLSLLLEAWAAGAILRPMAIVDSPAYKVRGIQLDLAREFFPTIAYLKRIVDRCADLKLNTLWLYLENHFKAPGLEDLSPVLGMTPAQAREISAYGAARGIDVVPGTNVISHMEGWFRLERYSDFCDGRSRSYPIPTRPEAFALVKRYLTALAKAFPSKNFHAGLDEYLFTGTNPEAAREIERHTKPLIYARFCRKVIRHLESLGKTVWYWDDMVLGKNVVRDIGFNADAPKALALFPKSTVATHWYYWTDADGKHSPILERVRKSGRRFVVAPSVRTYSWVFGNLRSAVENQEYMARCGLKSGAFGYVCTQWEASVGTTFEPTWPLLALSAEQAWSGGREVNAGALRALSFAVAGDTDGALGAFFSTLGAIEELLGDARARTFRVALVRQGPYQLWRQIGPVLDLVERERIAKLLNKAERLLPRIGRRDRQLNATLPFAIAFFREGLAIINAFDHAWGEWHRASLIERNPKRRAEFRRRVEKTVAHVEEALRAARRVQRALRRLEAVGHTPYDAHGLGRLIADQRAMLPLIRAAAREGNGLPYFEKLFYLPDSAFISNLKQFRHQSVFFQRIPNLPWAVRRR